MAYTSKFTGNQLVVQLQDQAFETQMTADIIVKKTETERGRVSKCDLFEHNGKWIDAASMLNRCIGVLCRMCEDLDKPASPKLEAAAEAASTPSPLADAGEGGSSEEVQRVENAKPAPEAPKPLQMDRSAEQATATTRFFVL